MEGQHRQIRDSYTFVLSGNTSKLQCLINPPVYLDGSNEMCLISLQTYNSIPNVTPGNNIFYYNAVDKGPKVWEKIVIPVGTYDIYDIEKYISKELESKVGGKEYFFLTGNTNTMKVSMRTTVDVDFTRDNNIGSLLGFTGIMVKRSFPVTSEDIVNINKISAVDIMCNIVDGSFINGEPTHILYHFYPGVAPGFKIIEVPDEKIYMPVNTSVLSNIVVEAVDQSGRPVDLRGEELTLYLRIRRKL